MLDVGLFIHVLIFLKWHQFSILNIIFLFGICRENTDLTNPKARSQKATPMEDEANSGRTLYRVHRNFSSFIENTVQSIKDIQYS